MDCACTKILKTLLYVRRLRLRTMPLPGTSSGCGGLPQRLTALRLSLRGGRQICQSLKKPRGCAPDFQVNTAPRNKFRMRGIASAPDGASAFPKGGRQICQSLKKPRGCAPDFQVNTAPRNKFRMRYLLESQPFGLAFWFGICGESGIRTHGPRERTTVFETAPFDHSGISPGAAKLQ